MSIRVTRSDLKRIVVAIDPAGTSNEDSDDTGIVVVARGPHQDSTCKLGGVCTGHGYVLDDQTCHLKPHGWAKRAIDAYDKWEADRIVAEVNYGGEMVEATVRAVRVGVPYDTVHASRGKKVRAEPVSALYEQGRFHHLGVFPELETELATWTQDSDWSPNRLDALVWGATYLGLIGGQGSAFMQSMKQQISKHSELAVPVELRSLPVLAHDVTVPVLRKNCKHRFFDGFCVHCGGKVPE